MKSIKKKLVVLATTTLAMLLMTGCETGLVTFVQTDLVNNLKQRGEDNKTCAAEFESAGIISAKQRDAIIKNIDKQVEVYTKKVDKIDENNATSNKALDAIAASVSRYELGGYGSPGYITATIKSGEPRTLNWYDVDTLMAKKIDCGGVSGYYNTDIGLVKDSTIATKGQDKQLPNFIVSNYIDTYVHDNRYTNSMDAKGVVNLPPDKIEPINLIGDKDTIELFNNLSKINVYVLKPDMLKSTNESTLDGVIAKIHNTVESKNVKGLSDYFEPALDKNGKQITLIDKDKPEYDIIANSKQNNDYRVELGYDLIINQYEKPVLHVRFLEFNQEALNNLNKVIGLNTSRYYLVKDGDASWKAFLMEYPVYMIGKMTNNGNNVDIGFQQSGVGLNLNTGKLIKYEKVNDKWDMTTGKEVNSDDYYFTVKAAQNNDAEGISSLVLKGYTKTTITDTSGKEFKVPCGRIVFRDYLEATFAPEYVNNENLVVFGRKIRFKMSDSYWHEGDKFSDTDKKQIVLQYPKGEKVAYFVDKNGNKSTNSPDLQITDFCSYKKLINTSNYKKCYVRRLSKIGEGGSTRKSRVKDGEIPKISDLKQVVEAEDKKSIGPTLLFPGEYIDKVDYTSGSTEQQRFPCIVTTKGLFDSALFSDWINSTSTTASLDWWETYLKNQGYSYEISHDKANEYLNSNYKYELSQNGIVILDLDVVAKIQEQYDKEAAEQKTSNIRTLFMILGWILIAYAMILMLAWVFDTSADFGVKLVNKLTLGHWIAVKYEDDVPRSDANEQVYLTANRMFCRCILIVVMGILLIRINIFRIVYVLIDIFGGVASKLEDIIQGF